MSIRPLSSCSLIHNGSNKSTLVPKLFILFFPLCYPHVGSSKKNKDQGGDLAFCSTHRGIAKAENRNEQDVELCWKDRCFSLVQGSREEVEVSLFLCILLHESFFSCSRCWPEMFIGKTRQ